jgi:phosphoserine phosphatase
MVTVSHKQSWLTTPCRVVIGSKEAQESTYSFDTKPTTINLNDTSFLVFDHATPSLIETAVTAITRGHSAAIIPHHCIKPQAIFFDMDATVIVEESLVEIAKAAGRAEDIATLTNAAMAGNMDFKESLRARLQLLKGTDRDTILALTPTVSKGMQQLATWCTMMGIPIFLVTGGFAELAEPIVHQLGFQDFRANRFAWQSDKLTGELEGPIVDAQGKLDAVQRWCRIYNFKPENCAAVGDGANDRLMLSYCGLAVGFCPKKILWDHLAVANHTADHRFLIEVLRPLQPIKS